MTENNPLLKEFTEPFGTIPFNELKTEHFVPAIDAAIDEAKTEIEALRSLVYRACEDLINGNDVTYLASMAKLKSGRLIREVSDTCLQFWGGMGFTWENYISKVYRDGRLNSIGGGTDEIMLKIICKHMGTLPK